MQIILPLLPDPTDIVIQGEQTVVYTPVVSMLSPVLQGQVIGNTVFDTSIPAALIGQPDWYGILPRQVGPMRVGGGEIVMQDIGRQPVNVFVDPIQRWLSSVFQIDQTGFMLSLYDAKTIGAPEPIAQFMVPEPETMGNPVVNIPRGAIARSGLAKRITMPVLPDSFGRHTIMDSFVETTRKWFISGITKDGTSTPVVSCRVIAMQTNKVIFSVDAYANPIVADIISSAADGSYLIQVNNNGPFWLIGYKDDTTDLAGSTINEVIPIDG